MMRDLLTLKMHLFVKYAILINSFQVETIYAVNLDKPDLHTAT